MKLLKISMALIFLFSHAPQASAGNGVERGDIDSKDLNIPQGIQVFLQHFIFEGCDLRGLSQVRAKYVHQDFVNRSSVESIIYHLQYVAEFSAGNRQVMINAEVEFLPSERAEEALRLIKLESPICFPYPPKPNVYRDRPTK